MDLDGTQEIVRQLHNQVNSLAEIVLQNRRGFNLLFMEQGELCAALGEECCFYANNSGVIIEALDKLQQRSKERAKPRKTARTGMSRAGTSPGITSLLAGFTGPVVTIILSLTLGPDLLNWVKNRIQTM